MMGDTDISKDFVWQFYHLKGDTLGEQKESLYKLLRKKNLFTNQEQLNNTLQHLRPETHVEHLFYVETLIYFKRTPELIEIVKQGNEVYISKIFKNPWFFKEAFENMDPSILANEFLPCLSFAIRMKVLKWLTVNLNEANMDKIFDAVLERYGIRIASGFLHACSSTKIEQVLSKDDNEIKLNPAQVKSLFDKSISIFKFYLKYHKDVTNSAYCDDNVFEHIARRDPVIILDLKDNLKSSRYRLGRRASKKVVGLRKDSIIKNINDYTTVVNKGIIVRQLQGSFKNIYLDLFPRKITEINRYQECNILLKFYPKSRRWDLFEHTFSQVFQDKNLLDILGNIDEEMIEVCPKKEIVYKWAEIKYKEDNDSQFLSSYEPEKAFSIIKEKINVTKKHYERQNLLRIMLICCKKNNDMVSLEKALQYICTRHRNEPSYIRVAVLDYITKELKLETLSETHWKYIKEMLDIMRIQGEVYRDHLLKKYIEFSYKMGKPVKDVLKEFIKSVISEHGYYIGSFLLNLKNPAVEKELLINMVNILPEIVGKEDKSYNRIYEQFVEDVVEFSIKFKTHVINLSNLQNLMEYIRDVLNETKNDKIVTIVTNIVRYHSNFPDNCVIENSQLLNIIVTISVSNDSFLFEDTIKDMVTKKKRSDFENNVLQCYFEKILDKHVSHDIIFWFMKNEPSAVFPFIEKIFEKYLNLDILSGIQLKLHLKGIKYTRFNFETKLIELFRKQLDNEECDRKKLIDFLFYLASTEELISFIEKCFLPKKQKIDLQDEEMKEIYEIQCHVAKSLKKVVNPNKMLPMVFNFTVGDYLSVVLPSLYSIFYRTPEKDLYEKMVILSEKSVSIRKHAIFLSCELLNINFTTDILKLATQKNVSSEKHRFSSTLKYFVKNPSQELFNILMSNTQVVDKNDDETLESLASVAIPKKYLPLYIEKCWEFFEGMKEKEVKIYKYLNSLLNVVIYKSNNVVGSLSSKFCRHVIESYFLTENDDYPPYVELFCCHVLRYRQSERIANFDLAFKNMRIYKVKDHNDRVKVFFSNLHRVACKDLDASFLKLCNEYWNNLFTPIEKFNEYVSLKLLLLKSESQEPFIENYAKSAITFLEELIAEYGMLIFQKFRNVLNEDLYEFDKNEEKYLLFYNMLKYRNTNPVCILVMDVMDKVYDNDPPEIIKTYNDILDILKSVNDPVVKIYYITKFSD